MGFQASYDYSSDISHSAPSASEESVCSVEPGSADDVGKIIQILGSSRTPFAVKGGGHAVNPGFSSTTGVQIAMTRWDQVYDALDHTGVIVIGGRENGVGVAGLTLGGGECLGSSESRISYSTFRSCSQMELSHM